MLVRSRVGLEICRVLSEILLKMSVGLSGIVIPDTFRKLEYIERRSVSICVRLFEGKFLKLKQVAVSNSYHCEFTLARICQLYHHFSG
jgi:hypothetical protein